MTETLEDNGPHKEQPEEELAEKPSIEGDPIVEEKVEESMQIDHASSEEQPTISVPEEQNAIVTNPSTNESVIPESESSENVPTLSESPQPAITKVLSVSQIDDMFDISERQTLGTGEPIVEDNDEQLDLNPQVNMEEMKGIYHFTRP